MGWRRAAYMQRARTSLLSHCGWLCRSGSSFVACWPGPTNSHTACWRAPTTAHRNTNQQDQCQSRAQPTACVARPTASPRRRESVGHFSRAHPGHFSRASKSRGPPVAVPPVDKACCWRDGSRGSVAVDRLSAEGNARRSPGRDRLRDARSAPRPRRSGHLRAACHVPCRRATSRCREARSRSSASKAA